MKHFETVLDEGFAHDHPFARLVIIRYAAGALLGLEDHTDEDLESLIMLVFRSRLGSDNSDKDWIDLIQSACNIRERKSRQQVTQRILKAKDDNVWEPLVGALHKVKEQKP